MTTRADYLTRFQSTRDEPLAKQAVSVVLPETLDAYVRSRPNKSEWLRRAIQDAAQKEIESVETPNL
jgi:hypothetical protein